jgi:hypothetical protein
MISRYLSALVLLSLAGCAAAPQDDSTPEDGTSSAEGVSALPDGDYVIHPAHSNKCVDVAAASNDNGARVQQYTCNGTVAQVFHVASIGGGYFEITNPHSGKAFDITDVSTNDGAPLQQWQYGGGANQQFRITSLGNGEFDPRPPHGQGSRRLRVEPGRLGADHPVALPRRREPALPLREAGRRPGRLAAPVVRRVRRPRVVAAGPGQVDRRDRRQRLGQPGARILHEQPRQRPSGERLSRHHGHARQGPGNTAAGTAPASTRPRA